MTGTKSEERPEDGSTKQDGPVTISAPPVAAVTIDPQNPLPETSFFWRRVITMVMAFGLLGLAWHNAIQLHDLGISADLLKLAQWCIALNGFVLLCYFVGPSAAEITSMIQSAKIIRSSLAMATAADKNQTDANISADNNASRPENPAVRRDSELPAGEGSGTPAPTLPDEAPGAIDYAPKPKGTAT